MSRAKMLGIGVSLVAVLLMFAGQAPATTYTSTQSGTWTDSATWGGHTLTSSDTGEVTNGYTVTLPGGTTTGTARVDAGGTLALTASGAVSKLYMEGGTLNVGSYEYTDAGGVQR